jgi:hypothetical protein
MPKAEAFSFAAVWRDGRSISRSPQWRPNPIPVRGMTDLNHVPFQRRTQNWSDSSLV